MHFIVLIAVASVPVGLLIGLTGAGGGSLTTPMLILLFHVTTASAVSSDLIASALMRPLGAVVHLRRQTVNLALVGWLSLGSVPAAVTGAALMHRMSRSVTFNRESTMILGALLIAGALALVRRIFDERRRSFTRETPASRGSSDHSMHSIIISRPLTTVAAGMFVGLGVAMTSVGAGALTMVFLLALYPELGQRELVGTDLAQAVPLTAAAAVGSILFWHVDLPLAGSILLGGVPGVGIGAAVSSRTSTRAIQPLIAIAILFAGLECLRLNELLLVVVVTFTTIALLILALGRPSSGSRLKTPLRSARNPIGCDQIPVEPSITSRNRSAWPL